MPALPTVNAMYVKKIRDLLRSGVNYRTAQLTLGSGTSEILIQAQDPGPAGNEITVEVTVPAGTSGLAVSVSGKAITIELAVNAGTPDGASNTATLIAAAINNTAAAAALVRAFVPPGSGTGSLSAAMAATALSGGSMGSGESTVQTLPLNFLRAQDMASVLEVLQDALDQPSALTATGGTARSVQDTGAFAANTQVGNIVRFTGNVTSALAGVEAAVVSNTADELFFASGALPATPVAGDTFTIRGALVEDIIEKLRDGRGPASSPAGNEYGDSRLVVDALVRMARQLGGTVSDKQLMSGTTASGSTTTKVVLDMLGGRLRPDQFKGMRLDVTGFGVRKIVGNDESGVFLDKAYSSAPGSGVAFTISLPQDSTDADANLTFAPGGQPANNRLLAELIRIAEAAVVAFTLPT